MNERMTVIAFNSEEGATDANRNWYIEMPWPWTFLKAKAVASNDSSATLAATGATAGAIFAATAIGDSGDPAEIAPTAPVQIAADELVTLTLDFDGASGTAAQNVSVLVFALVGEGA